ncbi:DUF418 domain-containing protein [Kribbella antibiotica]|uniref:DUF418 domain-containing protein n=1 Tax=Kribbella antibiotica TaxID=190195 RepID=A0A4R4ZN99_9ACTN|nr:DUF418 domain-containing protein [Kribbella antibiotica]TDD59770.1 DUF418 domain-containing protein [Kribbella antibiotica]
MTGPTALKDRALGPDLARGLLLLFIALANTHGFLHPPGVGDIRAMPIPTTLPDRIVAFLETTLVDGRSYTMFAALFGYGMVQIARRQSGDWTSTRKLLRRRGAWLLLLGLLHAVLLYYGDILSAYGLIALALVSAIRWSKQRLLISAAVLALLGSWSYALLSTPNPPDSAAEMYPWALDHNPLLGMAGRAIAIPLSASVVAVSAAGAFLFGIWAARRKLYERPEQHERTLRLMVAIGIPLSFLGGVPLALYTAGLLPATDTAVVPLAGLHALTGFAGGPAYAALIALWSIRVRRTPVITAIQATGQRSLTCYLAQSVVWTIAFAPYLLDLGSHLTLWQSVLLALGTWALTVLMADLMRRRGLRGPFEVLLRRLTYRNQTARQ